MTAFKDLTLSTMAGILTVAVSVGTLLWYAASDRGTIFSYIEQTDVRDHERDAKIAEMKQMLTEIRDWQLKHAEAFGRVEERVTNLQKVQERK